MSSMHHHHTRAAASYGRRRAGGACNVCRARKTKCDNQRPTCGFCLATGGHCSYQDESLDCSRLDRGSLAILQRISELEHNMGRLLSSATIPPPPQQVTCPQYVERNTSAQEPPPRHVSLEAQQQGVPPGQWEWGDIDMPPSNEAIRASTDMTIEGMLRWPELQVYRESAAPLIATLGQRQTQTAAESDMPYDDDEILDVEAETLHHLVANFLSNNHTKNPIFDVESLWAHTRAFSAEDGPGWDGRSCLILMICAVSMLSTAHCPTRHDTDKEKDMNHVKLARRYFTAARKRFGSIYSETSILAMQCHLLVAIYFMSTNQIFKAWTAFSQAGNCCVAWMASSGKISSSASPQAVDHEDAVYVEQSLYWSCMKSELELRTELGLPGSGLSDMRYPHLYPSPPPPMPKSWESASCGLSGDDRGRSEIEESWFFYLAEIAVRRIMNCALSARYGGGVSSSSSSSSSSWYFSTRWWSEQNNEGRHLSHYVHEMTRQLDEWHETLPKNMSFSQEPQQPIRNVLPGILRCHLLDVREVVYWPSLDALMTRPRAELGAHVLRLARLALENDVSRIIISEAGFWYRHQGTWLMIRSCSRSCFHLLGVAIRAGSGGDPGLFELLPSGWQEAVARVIQMIRFWEPESPDLTWLVRTLEDLYHRACVDHRMVYGGESGQ